MKKLFSHTSHTKKAVVGATLASGLFLFPSQQAYPEEGYVSVSVVNNTKYTSSYINGSTVWTFAIDGKTISMNSPKAADINCGSSISILLSSVPVPPKNDDSEVFDINGDGQTGLAEAIYALQVVAGVR